MDSDSSAACLLEVFLKPKAKNNKIVALDDSRVTIAVTAPPVDNKANAALIKFIADQLGIRKSACTIVKGYRSRNKVVTIIDMPQETVFARLRNRIA
ncbi:MAG: YggU family protein [Chitinivibrionales bacterium]|nr:YggU family protein [Chitinivibrionales bacterium]